MVIPGYDPEDLDDALESMLSRSHVESYLSPAERQRYDEGESLVDLLDDEEIHRLLDEQGETGQRAGTE